MKIMICMGGEIFSGGTIRFGGRIARAFQADVSVLYVENSVSYFLRHEVQLSRQKLSEWSIEMPAMRLLKMAREVLLEMGLIRVLDSGEVETRHDMKSDVLGAYEWHGYGPRGENVRFRVREGEIVDNIKAEVESGGYDLVVVGASRKRRLVHKILQFVDTSILVVKNPQDREYGFLLCTDGSEGARKAELFAAKAARLLNAHLTVLSVVDTPGQQHHAMEAVERCARFLSRGRVSYDTIVREGEVEKVILAEARPEQVIVLGASRGSEWKKFLMGSTPIRISQNGQSPVMIVK
jgi:nucleotide-binding universal stress UspA family protein